MGNIFAVRRDGTEWRFVVGLLGVLVEDKGDWVGRESLCLGLGLLAMLLVVVVVAGFFGVEGR